MFVFGTRLKRKLLDSVTAKKAKFCHNAFPFSPFSVEIDMTFCQLNSALATSKKESVYSPGNKRKCNDMSFRSTRGCAPFQPDLQRIWL